MTGLAGTVVLEPGQGIPPNLAVSARGIPGIWGRWDAGPYLAIATSGYEATLEQNTLGFFPLYPLLVQALSRLTGLNPALAGMFIAQVSYLVAILLFYKLARLIHDDHGYAWRSTLFLTLFPTAFFYLALYAESLYLALAILTVYLLLRPRPHYGWAGGLVV
jgi:Gpi18-like mannosyltransferase